MNYKPIYSWDPTEGVATCTIVDPRTKRTFVGTAKCAPEDKDMHSEKTGLTLAELRVERDYLKWVRDSEIKPALAALQEYANAIEYTPNVPKRAKGILYHRINKLNAELKDVNMTIKDYKAAINNVIVEKEKFYQQIRKNREQINEARNKDKVN